MLMTNQLPINWYMVHKAKNIQYEPWCEQWKCEQEQIQDTVDHVLFACPGDIYKKPRKKMINEVIQIYRKHNQMHQKQENKIEIIEDQYDEQYAKLFIYPSLKLSPEQRAMVHKEVIKYILHTRGEIMEERYGKGECKKCDEKTYNQKWRYTEDDEAE